MLTKGLIKNIGFQVVVAMVLGAVVGALSFAAAIGVNFIPGVIRRRQITSR